MISLLFIILGILLIVGYVITKRNVFFTEDKFGNIKTTDKIMGPALAFIMILIIGFAQPFSLERVDAGYTGIKVKLAGAERGVSSYQYKTGWVVYNSWTEQLLEFPIFQQHIEYPEQIVITKGGFSATIKPTFNYSLIPTNIGNMFENLRKPINEVETGWLQTAIVGGVMDVANKWKIDDIFNQREKFEAAIMTECNKRISQWFIISQLRTNIVPPPSLQKAIEDETKAIKETQAIKMQAIKAEANGEKLVAQAKADSAQRVILAAGKANAVIIEAKAEAEAIKIKQKEVSAVYNDYIRSQKWDGKYPTTMLGGNTTTMLNLK